MNHKYEIVLHGHKNLWNYPMKSYSQYMKKMLQHYFLADLTNSVKWFPSSGIPILNTNTDTHTQKWICGYIIYGKPLCCYTFSQVYLKILTLKWLWFVFANDTNFCNDETQYWDNILITVVLLDTRTTLVCFLI